MVSTSPPTNHFSNGRSRVIDFPTQPHTHGGPLCLSRTRMFGSECPWDGKIRNASEDRRGRGEELSELETGRGVLEGGTDKGEKRGYGEEGLCSDSGSVIKFRAVRIGGICHWWDKGFLSLFRCSQYHGYKNALVKPPLRRSSHLHVRSSTDTKVFSNGTSTFVIVCNRNSLCVCQYRNRSLDIAFSN